MKISVGEKIVPKPVAHVNDANNIWGQGWHARRRDDGYVVRYQTAGHGTSDNELAISEAEFAELRADPGSFDRILRAHGE